MDVRPRPRPAMRVTTLILRPLATPACALPPPAQSASSLAGMQPVSGIASIFGRVWPRGSFGASPGLALACIDLSIAISSLLSYVSFRGPLGPVSMKAWLLILFALIIIQSFIAAASVIRRFA